MSGQWLTLRGNPAAIRISSIDSLYREGSNVVAIVGSAKIVGSYSSVAYADVACDKALEAIDASQVWLTLTGDDGEIIKARPSAVTGVEMIPQMDDTSWTVRISKPSGRSGTTYANKADAMREFEAASELCEASG